MEALHEASKGPVWFVRVLGFEANRLTCARVCVCVCVCVCVYACVQLIHLWLVIGF